MSKRGVIPLVDGDILVYRLGFAADARAKKNYPGFDKEVDYLSDVLNLIDITIDRLIDKEFSHPETSYIFLSGKTNFRDDIATIKPYKGNREGNSKPKYYNEIREYLIECCGADMTDGIEADDAMGTFQFGSSPKSTCIVTIDKDLNMIPGLHYNFVKEKHYYVTETEAYISFFRQLLEGDTTDNIPGITGIGPVTARKHILETLSEERCVEICKDLYRQQYGAQADQAITEIANLLWIRRKEGESCPYFGRLNASPQVDKEAQRSDSEVRVGDESSKESGSTGSVVHVRDCEGSLHSAGEET